MTQPAKSQEPSMEEILASIRRIIADDDVTKTIQRAPETPKAEPPPAPPQPSYSPPPLPRIEEPTPSITEAVELDQSSDILELTETMAASMPKTAPEFRTIDGTSDVGFDDAGDKLPPAPAMPTAAPERGGLVSSETSAAVDSAFSALAQTVLVQNARTLEDLVREMLRPMLKSWLDDNLPGMVERMVRAEIERVSRGRTG
jgi:uncharacterized protein